MMILQFVLEAIRGVPQAFRDDKALFLLVMVMSAVGVLYHLKHAVEICIGIRNPLLKILVFVVEFLGSLVLLLCGIIFVRAEEIAELKPEMLNRRFFLEIIIAAIFYCLFMFYLYSQEERDQERQEKMHTWTKEKQEESGERQQKQGDAILKGIAVIFFSGIGFFAGTKLVDLGPKMFGKTIGGWLFSYYAGWTTSVLISFFALLVEIPIIALVGNRQGAFVNDFEDSLESAVDKGFDNYEKGFGNKSASEKKRILMRLLAVGAAVLAAVLLVIAVRAGKSGSSSSAADAVKSVEGTSLTGNETIEDLTEMAEAGDVAAQKNLAYRYVSGIDVEPDQEQALYWYVRAAEAGDADAQRNAGFYYANSGGETAPNYAEAMRWSMAAAEQGNSLACYDIGWLYKEGNGVEKNYAEAEKWFVKSFDNGCITACHEIGYLYLYPDEPNQPDSVTAAEWFARGADRGDAACAVDLGTLYEEGNGVEQSYEKAAELYLQAAEGDYGNSYAQYHLGILYENGWGVTADRDQALYWYKAAADQGHAGAQSEYDRLSSS